jgi:lipoprotein-anchoring transpeptidase ErfK/SrfK
MSIRPGAGRRGGVLLIALAALGIVGVAIGAHEVRSAEAGQSPLVAPDLPRSPEPAFAIARPVPLAPDREATQWAPVLHRSVVRAEPNLSAASLGWIVPRTPEGTENIVPVLARTSGAARLWVRVRVPALPENATGWVFRGALGGYTIVRTRLVVDTERFEAVLYDEGRPVFGAQVGVGTEDAPTPRGEFYVRNVLTGYRSAFYGPVAFGTSARSAVLTDWPAGGFVGIHGTDRPELLPGRVSHGCIRMKNRDILRLARLMPVGTPVTIR